MPIASIAARVGSPEKAAMRDRTRDQMIQAARSGKQNILEGSEASGTSKESEIKLTGIARASQKELLSLSLFRPFCLFCQ